MRTHTGEKPYKCKYCDRAFSQSNDLVKHTRSHVGDNTYKCPDCPESFRLLGELRAHSKVHFVPPPDAHPTTIRAQPKVENENEDFAEDIIEHLQEQEQLGVIV